MTQGARRSLPYPDISPLDGEIHVFPTLGTFLWYLATRVFYTATEYPTKYWIIEILRDIIYPTEYSYDFTEVPAGYLTFSISYLIYSTSHWPTLDSRICRPHCGRRMITKFIPKDQERGVEDAAIRNNEMRL